MNTRENDARQRQIEALKRSFGPVIMPLFADNDDVLNEIIALYEADDEGDDEDEGETCDECGAQVDEVIGCPDGNEICRKCFDQGAH